MATSKPPGETGSQSARFIEAAKKTGADKSGKKFEKVVKAEKSKALSLGAF